MAAPARPRRRAAKPPAQRPPSIVVTRRYAPDLQRQVAALLALLTAPPGSVTERDSAADALSSREKDGRDDADPLD